MSEGLTNLKQGTVGRRLVGGVLSLRTFLIAEGYHHEQDSNQTNHPSDCPFVRLSYVEFHSDPKCTASLRLSLVLFIWFDLFFSFFFIERKDWIEKPAPTGAIQGRSTSGVPICSVKDQHAALENQLDRHKGAVQRYEACPPSWL